MSARRPLLTALGATTLLAALWFVPSANATAPEQAPGRSGAPSSANTDRTTTLTADLTAAGPDAPPDARPAAVVLADTGSADTTPYLLGGTLFLGVGAGFVAFSVRRSRTA
ncbi:LPXTG cell wall anchor domain-containing protein [Streptomyces sp. NBC_00190]|uniref:LPXTG cell wall anchor domain-containing protein n=1 Tax=unclassified Streptomyces TaxID=2593676 RepID=UPI002E2D836C|nr:LPXTG cell wall anchor domain-containing protein [Streptomyces sp. NBC_00190]WSZ42082.1 LPXTG cell wall anchor domain-containing protein [Streptomyces sp. NBC_00868]